MNKVGILVLFIFGMVGLAMLSSVTSSAKPKKPVSSSVSMHTTAGGKHMPKAYLERSVPQQRSR